MNKLEVMRMAGEEKKAEPKDAGVLRRAFTSRTSKSLASWL
jgi:hypothetical protein